ncbi:MAG: hypothetical protein IPG76_12785 [Acidobacteria bacterium]|nr:hypothetical protein [Acidobacteriota bacterium]
MIKTLWFIFESADALQQFEAKLQISGWRFYGTIPEAALSVFTPIAAPATAAPPIPITMAAMVPVPIADELADEAAIIGTQRTPF